MKHLFAVSWSAFVVAAGGCASEGTSLGGGGSGGAAVEVGAAGGVTGGSGGSGAPHGGAVGGSAAGSLGVPGSAANGGSSSGGSAGGVSAGAGNPSAGGGGTTGGVAGGPSASTGGTAGAAGSSTGVSVGGTHPFVLACAPNATRVECCMHYCNCMMANCSNRTPMSCVETCSAADNKWNLKCRVEQCFQSLNPKYPQDKGSHCGHAVEQPPKCEGIIP